MRRPGKSYILIGILAIVAILVVAIPGIIPVSEISCESQFGPCRSDVGEALDRFQGESFRSAKKQISTYLKGEVYIESFVVRFILPNALKVYVIEKKPVYAIHDLDKQAIALTDKEGYIVAIVEGTNLPVIVGRGLFGAVGEKVGSEILFGLEVLSDMFQYYQVKEAAFERSGLSVKLGDGPKVVFPLEGDKAVLISSLRLIISKIEEGEEGKSKQATIDLRFKNPVVTYQ